MVEKLKNRVNLTQTERDCNNFHNLNTLRIRSVDVSGNSKLTDVALPFCRITHIFLGEEPDKTKTIFSEDDLDG